MSETGIDPITTAVHEDAPPLTGIHHVGITVTDLARSLAWYTEMLGMVHWGEERYPGGRTALLMRPDHSVHLGLDEHERNAREPFEPHRTGLDHLSLAVASRADLERWHAVLTARGADCDPVKEVVAPAPCALFSLRDPDGVALEIITMG